jgi:two-component system, chemotaxis family, sensor kinase CheA
MSASKSGITEAETVKKYRQAFQEEAREILVDLEATLLQLNEDRSNSEVVGQAFRGLHTIKGSGAMFGFDDIAAFTHNIENAYDEVRNGRLRVTSALVDISLSALDHIKAMLGEASGLGIADVENGIAIQNKLRTLTGSVSAVATPTQVEQCIEPPSEVATNQGWRIRFVPGPDLMFNGTDPFRLLDELRELGPLLVQADLSFIPVLEDLAPQRCYVVWNLVLTTTAPVEAIKEVFIFVEDNCELSIEAAGLVPTVEKALAPIVQPTEFVLEPEAPKFMRRADDAPAGASNIRVPTAKLDQFVDLVGELVTVQARLAQIASRLEDPDVEAVSEEIERLTGALRENSMSIRMLPVRATFERFRRLVHDLARELHKDVELTIEGADTELDKTVIDQLNDPLMHLIRNSMDHGIESPEARIAAGKPATAHIHLSARHSGASVLIGVSDDGRGIDTAAVRQRGIERGLIAADAQIPEAEIFALIFEAGFSTAQQVTNLSGRGVGMDVVRRRIEGLRGSIEIASQQGSGTGVTLRLPLTLAIIDGLLVRVGDAFFVLPLANSLECIELTQQDIVNANGKHVAHVRGEIIPYIRLREYFDIRTERPEREQIMIAEAKDGRYGFVVDEVLGDHQTVIKNLGRLYRNVQFVSGATILGNGDLALILDPSRIVEEVIRIRSSGQSDQVPASAYKSAFSSIAGSLRAKSS